MRWASCRIRSFRPATSLHSQPWIPRGHSPTWRSSHRYSKRISSSSATGLRPSTQSLITAPGFILGCGGNGAGYAAQLDIARGLRMPRAPTPSAGRIVPASALRSIPNSMNLDRQRFGLFGLRFGYVNAQHSVLGFGTNALVIDGIRQHKTTREGAVDAFDPDCVFVLLLAFQFPFAAHSEDTVRHRNLYVFLLDVRKLELDEILILGFTDVRERYPVPGRSFVPSCPVIGHVRRKSTQGILELAKWFPT